MNSTEENIAEREKILERAQQNPVLKRVAEVIASLVEKEGIPEAEIANALLDSDYLIGLVGCLCTVAAVTRRLTATPPYVSEKERALQAQICELINMQRRYEEQAAQLQRPTPAFASPTERRAFWQRIRADELRRFTEIRSTLTRPDEFVSLNNALHDKMRMIDEREKEEREQAHARWNKAF